MDFLQLNIKYGKTLRKMDNRFKGYIYREDNGYFEGVVLDLESSDNGSFVFGTITDDGLYNIYQIFNRQGADYINYKFPIPSPAKLLRGKVQSFKEGKEKSLGYCFVSKVPIKNNVDLNELISQISSCKDKMTIYDKKTYESIINGMTTERGYIKQKTL